MLTKPIGSQSHNELCELEKFRTTKSSKKHNFQKLFFCNFNWMDGNLETNVKQAVESLLSEFHKIFARRRFDIGDIEKLKVQPTPMDRRAASSQTLEAPINIENDILKELALLHKYGFIKTLPFRKYESPIFAQRKPIGKLRLLVDLRKLNTLIADDYINNEHPVSSLSDAAQLMA